MLVLTRQCQESLLLAVPVGTLADGTPDYFTIEILVVKNGRAGVRLGIECPNVIKILRKELAREGWPNGQIT